MPQSCAMDVRVVGVEWLETSLTSTDSFGLTVSRGPTELHHVSKASDTPVISLTDLSVSRQALSLKVHLMDADKSVLHGNLPIHVQGTHAQPRTVRLRRENGEGGVTVDGKGGLGEVAAKLMVECQWSPKLYSTYPQTSTLINLVYLVLFLIWLLPAFVIIPVPVNLIISATCIVYIGCHQSLWLLDHGHENAGEREVMTTNDAYKFPIIGSVVLFSLYLAFKYLDKKIVNIVLACYFLLVGIFTIASTLAPLLSQIMTNKKKQGFQTTLPYLGHIDLRLTHAEMVCVIIAAGVCGLYQHTKHFLLNNLIGICLCVQATERLSLGSFKVGGILLCGLFLYDIWWVFGTEVMVTVAKSFDGPIKLLFPRSFASVDAITNEVIPASFSLLGLGDIVVPGFFLSLLLRFDAVLSHVDPRLAQTSNFPRPYYFTGIIAYALGLVMTVFVMYYFKAAQPALLYLVPACLGAALAVGLVKKELRLLMTFEEDEPVNDDETDSTSSSSSSAGAAGGGGEKRD